MSTSSSYRLDEIVSDGVKLQKQTCQLIQYAQYWIRKDEEIFFNSHIDRQKFKTINIKSCFFEVITKGKYSFF